MTVTLLTTTDAAPAPTALHDAPADETEDDDDNKRKDGAEKLLRSLYVTLHDDLRENP